MSCSLFKFIVTMSDVIFCTCECDMRKMHMVSDDSDALHSMKPVCDAAAVRESNLFVMAILLVFM